MKQQEGVIKYTLDHCYSSVSSSMSTANLNAWRTVLFKLGLIGQVKNRYDGYGFGNVSQRVKTTNALFIISGTQTGHLESLSNSNFCNILEANPTKNSIKSSGSIKPSSEALTHASIYQQNNKIQSVLHIHCPEIWNNTRLLNLACTSADIEYGTPKMAAEVGRLLQQKKECHSGVFSMLGHTDGVIAFSDSIEKAAYLLINLYSQALILENNVKK